MFDGLCRMDLKALGLGSLRWEEEKGKVSGNGKDEYICPFDSSSWNFCVCSRLFMVTVKSSHGCAVFTPFCSILGVIEIIGLYFNSLGFR